MNDAARYPPSGLASEEARRRLAAEGPNTLPSRERNGIAALLWGVLREPMFLLLIAASAVYLVLGDTAEALVLAASIVVIVAITVVQERRTERALEALRDLSSPRALVIRDGVQSRIFRAVDLQVGMSCRMVDAEGALGVEFSQHREVPQAVDVLFAAHVFERQHGTRLVEILAKLDGALEQVTYGVAGIRVAARQSRQVVIELRIGGAARDGFAEVHAGLVVAALAKIEIAARFRHFPGLGILLFQLVEHPLRGVGFATGLAEHVRENQVYLETRRIGDVRLLRKLG